MGSSACPGYRCPAWWTLAADTARVLLSGRPRDAPLPFHAFQTIKADE